MNKGKKFISLFLIFSILALSGNLMAKEKRGAQLIVQKKDGQQVKGELIAVKENSLLMLESESGADVSINVENIKFIKIVGTSKSLLGAGLGFLAGGVLIEGFILVSSGYIGNGMAIGYWLLVFGPIGALLGTLIGATVGEKEKIYRIDVGTQEQINMILEKLSSKARIPDYE